jgi:Domain of unknown function (DUF3342)
LKLEYELFISVDTEIECDTWVRCGRERCIARGMSFLLDGKKVAILNRLSTVSKNNNTDKLPPVIRRSTEGTSHGASSDEDAVGSIGLIPGSSSSTDDVIRITVIESINKKNKKYCCRRSILTSSMHYFQDLLSTDTELSIHCDALIFEWLLEYIHRRTSSFDVLNVISILISSEFLMIPPLMADCIQFVVHNLTDILRQPIDLKM